jgi:hypothetical protein
MGGVPFLAPVISRKARILDIGCGSGAWAMNIGMVPCYSLGVCCSLADIADTHPEWQVTLPCWSYIVLNAHKLQIEGYDISSIVPEFQPPNCDLFVDDCNLPFVHRDCFTFIHVRCMTACIVNWPAFLDQCFQ